MRPYLALPGAVCPCLRMRSRRVGVRLQVPLSSERVKKYSDSLDQDAGGFLPAVHKGPKILKVTSEQVGRMADCRGLKNWAVLVGEHGWGGRDWKRDDNLEGTQQGLQALDRPGGLPREVAARLFDGVLAGRQRPETLPAKFNEQRSLPVWIVRRSEQHVGIQEKFHRKEEVLSSIRARVLSSSLSSASHRAICASL